eukprot:7395444-Heterocapsa_arctica.AAC.1
MWELPVCDVGVQLAALAPWVVRCRCAGGGVREVRGGTGGGPSRGAPFPASDILEEVAESLRMGCVLGSESTG